MDEKEIDAALKSKYFVISIVGSHAGEGIEKIFERKKMEIGEVGTSFWLIISHEAKTTQIQKMCREAAEDGGFVYCLFIDPKKFGNARPTKEDALAKSYSVNGSEYFSISEKIRVTGKIQKSATGMVFGHIEVLNDQTKEIDLGRFLNYNSQKDTVKLSLGKSSMCIIKNNADSAKPDQRKIVAIAKLKEPYAVYLSQKRSPESGLFSFKRH